MSCRNCHSVPWLCEAEVWVVCGRLNQWLEYVLLFNSWRELLQNVVWSCPQMLVRALLVGEVCSLMMLSDVSDCGERFYDKHGSSVLTN